MRARRREEKYRGSLTRILYYFDRRFTACYTLPIQFTEVTVHSWLLPVTELNIVHDQTYGCPFEEIIPTFQLGCAEIYIVRGNIRTVRGKVVIAKYILFVPQNIYISAQNILACAEILSLAAEIYLPCAETYSPCAENYSVRAKTYVLRRNIFEPPQNFLFVRGNYYVLCADFGLSTILGMPLCRN
jgi:hypothetical protein